MNILFSIDNAIGQENHFLHVYQDHIEIIKPKGETRTLSDFINDNIIEPKDKIRSDFDLIKGFIKRDLSYQGTVKGEEIGIDVFYSQINNVFFRRAVPIIPDGFEATQIFQTGFLSFALKYCEWKQPTMFNYGKMSNCIKFNSGYNNEADRIVQYIKKNHPSIIIKEL